MLWQFYLRGGTVFAPTVAQTEAGYHIDIDPVDVVSAAETETLRRAIKNSIQRGNPSILTPMRTNFPPPVVLKYAGVESWAAFEKGTLLWQIVEISGAFQIKQGRKRLDKGWEAEPTMTEVLPSATSDEIVQRLITLIQNSESSGSKST